MSSSASIVETPSETADSQFIMSRADRLAVRNVHFYDARHPTTLLGGLFLAQKLTNSSVYAMLDKFITLIPSEDTSFQSCVVYFSLRTEDGVEVEKDNNIFKEGTYYLDAASEIRCDLLLCCMS